MSGYYLLVLLFVVRLACEKVRERERRDEWLRLTVGLERGNELREKMKT